MLFVMIVPGVFRDPGLAAEKEHSNIAADHQAFVMVLSSLNMITVQPARSGTAVPGRVPRPQSIVGQAAIIATATR